MVKSLNGFDSFLDELNSHDSQINKISAAPKYQTWTSTVGQLTYVFPTDSYTIGQLTVYVGGIQQIPGAIVREDSTTQFTLLVDSSEITAGMNVVAVYR